MCDRLLSLALFLAFVWVLASARGPRRGGYRPAQRKGDIPRRIVLPPPGGTGAVRSR